MKKNDQKKASPNQDVSGKNKKWRKRQQKCLRFFSSKNSKHGINMQQLHIVEKVIIFSESQMFGEKAIRKANILRGLS